MCGITGLWARPPLAPAETERLVCAMANTLAHRGPDDSGIWLDERAGIAFGHRRLSIIDLSPAGHQPMFSADGRWVLCFNGEIYNFLELKKELANAAAPWRGNSDTEVILAAISAWGFDRALARIAGMFAFALWDRSEHRLYLVRDRVGKKPLYVYHSRDCLLFGSELKALCAAPIFPRTLDRGALALYLRYTNVPSPSTIYRDTIKVPPGQYAAVEARSDGAPGELRLETYWDAQAIAENGAQDLLTATESEIIASAESLLLDAVKQRMIADVPLGALLSGGIDSSTITALMQQVSSRPVKTFTIGVREAGFNEAEHARAVAQHLGTEHTELYVTPGETLALIPHLAAIYDEPFADSSQIPTWCVSKLARGFVTVALSGDGGDELFGGYNRYNLARRTWDSIRWIPGPLRHAAARAVTGIPQENWDRLYRHAAPLLPNALRVSLPGDKMHKFAHILASSDSDWMYRQMLSCWPMPEEILRPHLGSMTDAIDPVITLQRNLGLQDLDRMMLTDLKTYLPEDILVKVDRASMSVSLEMRAPFLDHRVVEFMWHLPGRYKIRSGETKWLLRRILHRYVPRELVDRPKIGFGVPIGEWLRGPLKDWGEDLLSATRLEREGIFQAGVVRRYWNEHASGARNWQYRLWTILMFQAWLQKWNPRLDAQVSAPGDV